MKVNAPKRKVFQDALDLLAEDPVEEKTEPVNGIVSLPVDEIHPFHDHPFRLYEGERLDDMVQSIKDYGVLNPVIVRKAARGYEMLAGHNRTNAARIAGLTEVPAIVKTDLSDEDAYVYVIETNLLQRSFADLLPSEKAAVLVARYEKISSQGKRNDIMREIEVLEETCGHDVHKSQKSRDGLGEEYGMTGRNIARYNSRQLTGYRRNDIGFVFQFYNLIPDLTVQENIQVVADIAKQPMDIEEVMKALDIDKYKNRFPKELSGGQQQRVAIARALIKNPKILLCDELTGALDSKSSRNVLKFIEKVNEQFKTTIIIITHNEAIADMADTVIRIKDGQVASCTNNGNKRRAEELEL